MANAMRNLQFAEFCSSPLRDERIIESDASSAKPAGRARTTVCYISTGLDTNADLLSLLLLLYLVRYLRIVTRSAREAALHIYSLALSSSFVSVRQRHAVCSSHASCAIIVASQTKNNKKKGHTFIHPKTVRCVHVCIAMWPSAERRIEEHRESKREIELETYVRVCFCTIIARPNVPLLVRSFLPPHAVAAIAIATACTRLSTSRWSARDQEEG